MEGACILRKELDGIHPTSCVSQLGLNFRLGSILPDLIVTLKGKTFSFVIANRASFEDKHQATSILDRYVYHGCPPSALI